MIKAIIFDLGNVLLNWKPGEFLAQNGFHGPELNIILNEIFFSNEWGLLDNGDITTDEAIEIISLKSSLPESKIRAIFDLRLKIITPVDSNVKLLPELKKRGFLLYYLSNFPDDIFDEVRNKYDFFRLFDGGEISARLNMSKPDERIFRYFLSKYSLRAEESLFIDDSEKNAGAAEKTGMRAIHLTEPSMLKLLLEQYLGSAVLS